MKSRFAAIALTIVVALLISTLARVSSAEASKHHKSAVTTIQQSPAEPQSEALPRALTPDRAKFRPRPIFIASAPNFGKPARRAPMRRKGQIQH